MKKALYLPVAVLLVSAAIPAYALDVPSVPAPAASNIVLASADMMTGAKSFIQDMAQRGIDFLGNDKLSAPQRREEFRKLLHASYDMPTIGRFALGTYWRSMNAQQQSEYQTLFEKMIVDVYSRRFSDYKGQKLEVRNARVENDSDVIVNSWIVPKDGGDEVEVDWRVRQRGGQYKVIDVVVAGVSMVLTQRSDFSSVIQRGGGDVKVLLAQLREGKTASAPDKDSSAKK